MLYEEIVFLKHFAPCKWVSENVIPYYKPMIMPNANIGRHLFWSNFYIREIDFEDADIHDGSIKGLQEFHGVDISKYKIKNRKDQILRNMVNPKLGKYILDQSMKETSQMNLFEN